MKNIIFSKMSLILLLAASFYACKVFTMDLDQNEVLKQIKQRSQQSVNSILSLIRDGSVKNLNGLLTIGFDLNDIENANRQLNDNNLAEEIELEKAKKISNKPKHNSINNNPEDKEKEPIGDFIMGPNGVKQYVNDKPENLDLIFNGLMNDNNDLSGLSTEGKIDAIMNLNGIQIDEIYSVKDYCKKNKNYTLSKEVCESIDKKKSEIYNAEKLKKEENEEEEKKKNFEKLMKEHNEKMAKENEDTEKKKKEIENIPDTDKQIKQAEKIKTVVKPTELVKPEKAREKMLEALENRKKQQKINQDKEKEEAIKKTKDDKLKKEQEKAMLVAEEQEKTKLEKEKEQKLKELEERLKNKPAINQPEKSIKKEDIKPAEPAKKAISPEQQVQEKKEKKEKQEKQASKIYEIIKLLKNLATDETIKRLEEMGYKNKKLINKMLEKVKLEQEEDKKNKKPEEINPAEQVKPLDIKELAQITRERVDKKNRLAIETAEQNKDKLESKPIEQAKPLDTKESTQSTEKKAVETVKPIITTNVADNNSVSDENRPNSINSNDFISRQNKAAKIALAIAVPIVIISLYRFFTKKTKPFKNYFSK